ncbi:hypothetical protein HY638_03655 [Candidatus Woesearchaeota archaeon]|nr:hypothetical protein [Candidatus Woesearchaeota archaeon]
MAINAYDIIAALKEFFVDRQFLILLSSTVILFLAIFIMWFFYHKQLSRRDLFEIPRIDSKSRFVNFIDRFIYFFKYLVIFPLYSFIWFLIFSFLLALIAKSRPMVEIMFFGIVMVSVTRISAYVSPKLAEDMAKLLPWALIIVFLTDPQSVTPDSFQVSFSNFVQEIPKVAKYLFFIAFVEWVLRIGHWIISSVRDEHKPVFKDTK